jgi:molybdate-binding protein/transcriptional regulator with XRE-family HTH domain
MTNLGPLENHVRDHRTRRNWSQEELAGRAGLSRTGVSAIETGRLVPSAAAALALAAALECRVEDLFRLPRDTPGEGATAWAWAPRGESCRYWSAEVSGRIRHYPVEATPQGVIPHDGVARGGGLEVRERTEPARTLIIACCDPAVGLLADALARASGVRVIALPRSSGAALELLSQGLVHAAGVHLAHAGAAEGNAEAVRSRLGPGFRLLRITRWEEVVAFASARPIRSIGEAIEADLRWIGREPGSGARQCLDELLGERRRPRRLAADHRGVAEAIRSGWADAGVCLRLASEEAGLDALGIRHEAYDLCFPDALKGDPRLRALIDAVRSTSYRRLLRDLPGYETAESGEIQRV